MTNWGGEGKGKRDGVIGSAIKGKRQISEEKSFIPTHPQRQGKRGGSTA